MTTDPSELTGKARDRFDFWHGLMGLSEAAALCAVREDGLLDESGDAYDREISRWRTFGLNEAEARAAVRGREYSSDAAARAGLSETAVPWPAGAEENDPGFVRFARELSSAAEVSLREGVRRAVDLDRRGGRPSPAWAIEIAGARTATRTRSARIEEARARKPKPAKKTVESRRRPAGKGEPVELVEGSTTDADRVRFFREVMGLDESAAKAAAAGRTHSTTTRSRPF